MNSDPRTIIERLASIYMAKCDLDALRDYCAKTMAGVAFLEEYFFKECLGGPVFPIFKGRKN